MAWQLRHGETAEQYRTALQKRKAPIPKYLTPPEVMDGYLPWFFAFFELSTDRIIPGGPIPRSAIASFPIAEHERYLFTRCIRAMDRVFLDHYAPKKEGEPTKTFGPGMLKGKT